MWGKECDEDLTWDTVNELESWPKPVELSALIDIQDTISWRLAVPHCILQETLDSVQDYLEYAEAAA